METIIHTSNNAIAFEQENIRNNATFSFIAKDVGTEKHLAIKTWDGDTQSLSMFLTKQEALAMADFVREQFN